MQPTRKQVPLSPSIVDLSGSLQQLSVHRPSKPSSPSSVNGPYLAASLGFRSGNQQTTSSNYEPEKPSSPSLRSTPLHNSTDTLNSSGSAGSSSGLGSQNSSVLQGSNISSITASNASLADYLGQLVRDRKAIATVPGVFAHVGRLLDEEINKVRNNLFHLNIDSPEPFFLPEQEPGIKSEILSEKVFVPVDEHPDFNFVGRILGPRGMTAKQLEKQTQCKIMIRGKGSMRDKSKETFMTGKLGWEHLNEKLHVLITVEDTPDRAHVKLERAVDAVKKLLVPVDEEQDELKKRQLLELAILNGTCADKNGSPPVSQPRVAQMYPMDQAARMQAFANMFMAQRSSPYGPAMFMSPQMQRPMSAIPSSPHSAGSMSGYRHSEMAMGPPMFEPEYLSYYQAVAPSYANTNGDLMMEGWNGHGYR